jgi:tetrapyrrole methylase family protein/MazG family protein
MKYSFEDFVQVIARLRSKEGCPWDKKQTHESLKQYFIEETYEALDAIDQKNSTMLCEELGDVLLQILLHSQIAKEAKEFDISDVVHGITAKIISRHPHVFGQDEAKTAEDVVKLWDTVKKDEKKIASHTEAMKSIPKNMPALMRSVKVQDKAAKVGFDWENIQGAIDKVNEELEELLEANKTNDTEKVSEELGDLLFAVVNVSRFLKIHPELALGKTVEKFIQRFGYIEEMAAKNGNILEKMSLNEMDLLWNEAKTHIFLKKD